VGLGPIIPLKQSSMLHSSLSVYLLWSPGLPIVGHHGVLPTAPRRTSPLCRAFWQGFLSILPSRRSTMPMPTFLPSAAAHRKANGDPESIYAQSAAAQHENQAKDNGKSRSSPGHGAASGHLHPTSVERDAVDIRTAQGTATDGMALAEVFFWESRGVSSVSRSSRSGAIEMQLNDRVCR
jgi:hypothetical protein